MGKNVGKQDREERWQDLVTCINLLTDYRKKFLPITTYDWYTIDEKHE